MKTWSWDCKTILTCENYSESEPRELTSFRFEFFLLMYNFCLVEYAWGEVQALLIVIPVEKREPCSITCNPAAIMARLTEQSLLYSENLTLPSVGFHSIYPLFWSSSYNWLTIPSFSFIFVHWLNFQLVCRKVQQHWCRRLVFLYIYFQFQEIVMTANMGCAECRQRVSQIVSKMTGEEFSVRMFWC